MQKMVRRIAFTVAMICGVNVAFGDTIKVGVIGPFSGPFALQGKNFKAGIDAYFALNGKRWAIMKLRSSIATSNRPILQNRKHWPKNLLCRKRCNISLASISRPMRWRSRRCCSRAMCPL